MSRRTASITKRDVAAALSAVLKRGSEPYEIGDEKCSGLSLRVRTKSASWALRGRLGKKQSTWKIADVHADDDVNEIRERTHQAKSILKRGMDPQSYLQEKALGGAVVRHFDAQKDGWTFEEAREKFLIFVEKERAKATFNDYRKTLYSNDMLHFKDILIKNITKREISAVQDSIYERGAKAQATHTLRILKAFMNWCSQRATSGLEVSPANSVKLLSLSKEKREGRVPSPEEIGCAFWLLDSARVNPAARLAAALALLTAQRRETIASAERSGFKECEDGAIWCIAPEHMKSKREHVVFLPMFTWSIVKKAIMLGRSDSKWLFPQLRLRKAGDEGLGYMSAKMINDTFKEARSPIRPHDCRRAFATHGEALLGFKRSDTKAILDHSEGNSGDVTSTHYALHCGEHFKWSIMKSWERFVIKKIYEHADYHNEERLPQFLL